MSIMINGAKSHFDCACAGARARARGWQWQWQHRLCIQPFAPCCSISLPSLLPHPFINHITILVQGVKSTSFNVLFRATAPMGAPPCCGTPERERERERYYLSRNWSLAIYIHPHRCCLWLHSTRCHAAMPPGMASICAFVPQHCS